MSDSDLDSLYKKASAQDGARPSAAVHRSILEHARRVAEQAASAQTDTEDTQVRPLERARASRTAPSRWSRWTAHWPRMRWQIAVPLATAALAVILLQPQLRST